MLLLLRVIVFSTGGLLLAVDSSVMSFNRGLSKRVMGGDDDVVSEEGLAPMGYIPNASAPVITSSVGNGWVKSSADLFVGKFVAMSRLDPVPNAGDTG